MPQAFLPFRGKRRRDKKRQKPPPQALLGHQTSPRRAGCALRPCPRGCAHKLSRELQARLLWGLTPASRAHDAPCCRQPRSTAKERPQIQGQDQQQPVFPELMAATALTLLGLTCLSPWWLEKGTEYMSSKGCSIWNCFTSIHKLPKGSLSRVH